MVGSGAAGGLGKRRSGERHRRRVRVTFDRSPSFTVDVGPGGFCAQYLVVKPPGTRVEGTLLVEGETVAYSGVVVWSRAGEPRLGVHGRMGVSFTRVAPELAALLAHGRGRS